jgi:hypothetical protein
VIGVLPLKFNTGVRLLLLRCLHIAVPSPAMVGLDSRCGWVQIYCGHINGSQHPCVGSSIDRYRYVFVCSGRIVLATGASFTELTVIEIVALFDTNYYRLLCKSDWVALPAEVQYRCKVTTPALFTVVRSPATYECGLDSRCGWSKSTVHQWCRQHPVSLVVTLIVTGMSSFSGRIIVGWCIVYRKLTVGCCAIRY